jgi:hypothetical protein
MHCKNGDLILLVGDCGENFKQVLEFYQRPAKGLTFKAITTSTFFFYMPYMRYQNADLIAESE